MQGPILDNQLLYLLDQIAKTWLTKLAKGINDVLEADRGPFRVVYPLNSFLLSIHVGEEIGVVGHYEPGIFLHLETVTEFLRKNCRINFAFLSPMRDSFHRRTTLHRVIIITSLPNIIKDCSISSRALFPCH